MSPSLMAGTAMGAGTGGSTGAEGAPLDLPLDASLEGTEPPSDKRRRIGAPPAAAHQRGGSGEPAGAAWLDGAGHEEAHPQPQQHCQPEVLLHVPQAQFALMAHADEGLVTLQEEAHALNEMVRCAGPPGARLSTRTEHAWLHACKRHGNCMRGAYAHTNAPCARHAPRGLHADAANSQAHSCCPAGESQGLRARLCSFNIAASRNRATPPRTPPPTHAPRHPRPCLEQLDDINATVQQHLDELKQAWAAKVAE